VKLGRGCPISESSSRSIHFSKASKEALERLNAVESRKDFSNGPVWDPEREPYFAEVRFPDGSRKKKRFRRQREAQRWWSLQIAKSRKARGTNRFPRT
jgi:hypothetical protein